MIVHFAVVVCNVVAAGVFCYYCCCCCFCAGGGGGAFFLLVPASLVAFLGFGEAAIFNSSNRNGN